MAGLSKNVMNMKFMQKALSKEAGGTEEEKLAKVKDSSEWSLPGSLAKRKSLSPTVKVQTVGYGSIASITAQADAETEEERKQDSTPVRKSQTPEDEASKFLNGIEGKAKRSKKRSQKESKRPHKRTKTSKS